MGLSIPVKEHWGVDVAYVDEPYHAGWCLVNEVGRIVAGVRIFKQKQTGYGLTFDIRKIADVMPFVSASGKPLILVTRCPPWPPVCGLETWPSRIPSLQTRGARANTI